MRYTSTRGTAPELAFDEVLLAGLAPDGGLYVPAAWPRLSNGEMGAFAGLAYAELAARVMAPFVGERVAPTELLRIARESYAGFAHPAIAPLKQLDHDLWLLELFHGPTLAFKDHALQMVGRLFDLVLRRRGQRLVLVGATSGDTGSAAIEACRGLGAVDIFILHPRGRISEVQRRLMTTVDAANVHNIALDGTFDDCQDVVKALFSNARLREELRLGAVNSINWARIAAQSVYYVLAALALGAPARPVSFAVPTGNFGNVYAGYVAERLGLPIGRLVVASNSNDILTRFLDNGVMEIRTVVPTLSPSMDIQVSSNFERLLFDLYDRDGPRVAADMARLRRERRLAVDGKALARTRRLFSGFRLDDEGTRRAIKDAHDATGELLDPHGAVGLAAARAARCGAGPMVAIATAHPAEFPDAVGAAPGIRPALPARLADLFERPERVVSLPNDLAAIEAFIRARVGLRGAA
ncbi:MAG: threonine synthase [Alphaproteobacteria bacterium]